MRVCTRGIITSLLYTRCIGKRHRSREGSETGFLQALYPHQYGSPSEPKVSTAYSYVSARGSMKVIEGSSFTTVDTFHGLLPFLPLSRENADRRTLTQHLTKISEEGNHFPGLLRTLNRFGKMEDAVDLVRDGIGLEVISGDDCLHPFRQRSVSLLCQSRKV